jgi:uncharacterized membrane protein SpoIIM required for sporulation
VTPPAGGRRPVARAAPALEVRNVAAFVRGRRAGWERLAALVARARSARLPLAEVEELDRLYRRATAELALAHGRFPGSDAERDLSDVVASAYRTLYRPRASAAGRLRALRDEIPEVCRRHPGPLRTAVLFLGAGLAVGGAAVWLEPAAAALLVPEAIRTSVDAGRLWTGSLLSAAPGVTGAALAHNNVSAAGLAFALGLSGGVGTAAILLLNGVLIGAVLVYAAQHGLGWPLLGFLGAHGPLELSAFVLAAQAGFILATALVEPGELPRGLALQVAGREGARLLSAVVPALLLAALIEATVSPAATFPGYSKGALGLALAAALWTWLRRAGGRQARARPGTGA